MLFERAGGGRDAHKGNWNGGHVLGMAVVVGLSAALCQREEQQEANAVAAVVRADLDVLLALASLHRRSWRRLFCRRLCGRRGDCDVGGWAVGVVAAAGGAAGSNTVAAGVPGSAYRAQARKKTCPRRQEQRQWQQQLASKTT